MITEPLKFSESALAMVEKFTGENGVADSQVWTDSSLQSVRNEIKEYYRNAQKFRCAYCNRENCVKHKRAWDVDHIVPRTVQPRFTFTSENLCVACPDCNGFKGDTDVLVRARKARYPKNGLPFKIIHAHFDEWSEHIQVLSNYLYIPKTEKGKFTYQVCNLARFAIDHFKWSPGSSSRQRLFEIAGELLDNEFEPLSVDYTKRQVNEATVIEIQLTPKET